MVKKYKLATRIMSCLLVLCLLMSSVLTVSFTQEKTTEEPPVYTLKKITYSQEMPIKWRYTNASGYSHTSKLSNTYYRGASAKTPNEFNYVAYCMDWGVNGPNASGSKYDHPTDDVSATKINQLTYVIMNGYNGDGNDKYYLTNRYNVNRYGRDELLTDDGGTGTMCMQLATQIAVWLVMGQDSRGRTMKPDGWVRNNNCQNIDCDIMEMAYDLYDGAMSIGDGNLDWLSTDINNVQTGRYDKTTNSKLYGPIRIQSDFRESDASISFDLSKAPAGTKILDAYSLEEVSDLKVFSSFYVSVPNDTSASTFNIPLNRERGMVSPISYEEENETRQRMFFSALSSVSTSLNVVHAPSDAKLTIRKTNHYDEATKTYSFVGDETFEFSIIYYKTEEDMKEWNGGVHLGSFETDKDGYIHLSGLTTGYYKIQEELYGDSALQYTPIYIKNDETGEEYANSGNGIIGIKISDLEKDFNIHCHNKRLPTTIRIQKTDMFDFAYYKNLIGTKFTVLKMQYDEATKQYSPALDAEGKKIGWAGMVQDETGTVMFKVNGELLPYIPIEPVYKDNGEYYTENNRYVITEIPADGYVAFPHKYPGLKGEQGNNTLSVVFDLPENRIGWTNFISEYAIEDDIREIENRPYMSSLKIVKTDAVTGKPIADVQYNLYQKDEYGTKFLSTLVTDANGVAIYGLNEEDKIDLERPNSLLYGREYCLLEISAPEGYEVNEGYITVDPVTTDGGQIVMNLTNNPSTGNVSVNKVDGNHNKLQGVEFQIYRVKDGKLAEFDDYMRSQQEYEAKEINPPRPRSAPQKYLTYITKDNSAIDLTGMSEFLELVDTYSTDADGRFKTDLRYGDYVMIETKTLEGYSILNVIYSFSIYENNTSYFFECLNDPISGSVHLTKTNKATGEFIEGVKFDLFMEGVSLEEPEIKIGTYETDENGKLKVDGLVLGKYFFVEVSTPDRYKLPTEEESKAATAFEIKEDREIKTLDVTNEEKESNVLIYKTDKETGKPIKGAKFALMKDGEVYKEAVTDNDGIATFTNVDVGEYQLAELVAGEGYDINSFSPITITVDGTATQKVFVGNEKIKANIKILKVDKDTEKPLENVEFTLYKANDEENALRTLKTNAEGIVLFEDVEFGEYVIVETKTLDGYKAPESKTFVNVNETKEYFYTIANEVVKRTIKLTKVDKDTTIPIANVEFDVFAIVGEEKIKYTTVTTDENGECTFALPFGEYELVETKSGIGYKVSNETTSLDVTLENIEEMLEITIVNEIIKNKITLVKSGDEIGNFLSGATYGLYDLNTDELIMQGTTDEKGEFCFGDIPYGSYYFKEITAPEGYKLSEDVIKFTVDENSDAEQVINVVDHSVPQTGITTNTMLFTLLMAVSACLFVGIMIMERKIRLYTAQQ